MEKRCFLCMHKIDGATGLCTNPECIRSKPLPAPKAAKYTVTEKGKEDAGTAEQ